MKYKYVVSVSYMDFQFEDEEEAMIFARQAKSHYIPDKDDKSIKVNVSINFEEEKED